MLAEPVALHDVADVENFVQATINRARLVLSHEEREELVAEGMAIACKLANDYRQTIPGHGDNGRFSGYLAMFLPRKLGDAWHRMHPEHLLVTDAAIGKRRWRYTERAASLEAVMFDSETDRERRTPAKLTVKEQPDDFYERLAAALDARWERRREMILHVGGMLGEGAELGDVAGEMGLSLAQVREIVMEIAHVASELQVKT